MIRMTGNPRAVLCGAALALASAAPAAAADAPTLGELMEIIEAQQAQIDALRADRGGNRVHIGGYGELHYNNLSAEDDSSDLRRLDFHRFVLFIGYDFSERVRFYSELELEHALAGEGKPGEVELEQAYVQFDIGQSSYALGGLFLVPVGMLNETHEPPTFYGVERNDVEGIIIPTTWWAGGAMFGTRLGSGLSFDFAVHEGLKVPTSSFSIRSGRQKTANADASNLAYTGRVRYSGVPGLELAASIQYQSDVSQIDGDGLNDALLASAHLDFSRGIFGLRALWAGWDLNGAGPRDAGVDRQTGWYVEPALRPWKTVGFYYRYEDIDAARTQDRFVEHEAGVNWWPHPQVVIKADLRRREHDLAAEAGRDFDGIDLGIGYQF